jgi:hypothetical protein
VKLAAELKPRRGANHAGGAGWARVAGRPAAAGSLCFVNLGETLSSTRVEARPPLCRVRPVRLESSV